MSHYVAIGACFALAALGVLQLRGNGGLIGWVLVGFGLLGLRFWLGPRPGELALVAKCLGAIVTAVALFVGGLFAAWESAEVVALRYMRLDGTPNETRLWVVDYDGDQWVAMGSAKERVAALEANPQVELVRGDTTECRTAREVRADAATERERHDVERLYEEKYGWRLDATRALRFVFGAPPGEEPIGFRLSPCLQQ